MPNLLRRTLVRTVSAMFWKYHRTLDIISLTGSQTSAIVFSYVIEGGIHRQTADCGSYPSHSPLLSQNMFLFHFHLVIVLPYIQSHTSFPYPLLRLCSYYLPISNSSLLLHMFSQPNFDTHPPSSHKGIIQIQYCKTTQSRSPVTNRNRDCSSLLSKMQMRRCMESRAFLS
jgi:hypothetical protein